MRLTELESEPESPFPPIETALREPEGLLAWGGDLHPTRLVNAYRHGCFPWYDRGQPILWWSPDPRLVMRTTQVHITRRFARTLRRCDWQLTCDRRFGDVIRACADAPRAGQHGTWILSEMIAAYERLHALGYVHSIEATDAGGRLVGGVYGVSIGRMFFGESMFSAADNGSKTALLALCRFLCRQDMPLLDCQVETAHLRSLGAVLMSRESFLAESRELCDRPAPSACWRETFGQVRASALVQEPP